VKLADSLCDTTYITLNDLDFNDDKSVARIFLSSSKSDSKHMGVNIYLAANLSPSCPVNALLTLIASSLPKSRSSPLFSYDFKKPASRAQFISRFKKKLSIIVEDTKPYSGHSFRRGGAQSLYDAGLPIKDIQALGRWTTDLVARRYFGMTRDRLCEISKMMTSTASSRPLQFESLKPATSTLPLVSTLFGRVRKQFGATS
jgi:integrase